MDTEIKDISLDDAYEVLLAACGSDRAIINLLFLDGTKLLQDLDRLQKSWDRLDNELGETVEALIKSNRELDTYRAKASILKGRLAEYEAADHMGEEPF